MPERPNHTEALVLAFQDGDEKGFDFLFRQYYSPLCYFANTILDNEEEAKDIVQDCFVKLWRNKVIKKRFETIRSFLYITVRNSCIDLVRKKKVVRKSNSELKAVQSHSDHEFFDEIAFAELMRQVFDQIELFSPKIQKVFHLYYNEGKNYNEIADDLKTSPEAIRKQKARALSVHPPKVPFIHLHFFILVNNWFSLSVRFLLSLRIYISFQIPTLTVWKMHKNLVGRKTLNRLIAPPILLQDS